MKILEKFTENGVLDETASHVVSEFVRCAPWIKAALKHAGGTHNLEDILDGILHREYQFWPAVESVVITELVIYPRKKVLNLFLAGGNYEELRTMLPDLEQFGKLEGCSTVTLTGRKGWLRSFLPKEGYEGHWAVMTKEL